MRSIQRVVRGRHVQDGAGVDICRVIGTLEADYIDPFLMLDDFRNDDPSGYVAGFPPHPHRGFETVTYMLRGKMRHRDSVGNEGLLDDGSVQWMTAGKGIIHSEMPEQTDGKLWGFQLWLNLGKKDQMIDPSYQDMPASEIATFSDDDANYRLVAGHLMGHVGPARTHYPVLMVDIAVNAGHSIRIPVEPGFKIIAFCFEGIIHSSGKLLKDGDLAVFSEEEEKEGASDVELQCQEAEGGGRCLLLAAPPLNEKIEKYGPFVLSSREELEQAFLDFQLGKLAPNQEEFLRKGRIDE
jgi:quercetin 2,3-dioxygenase